MKCLKAYEVREPDEGHCCIRFATNNAAARREGANELDIEWESVEHCRRVPQFDPYAPGPVPVAVMLDSGWWYGCSNCGGQVFSSHEHVIDTREHVYCNQRCEMLEFAEERAKAAATVALIELVTSQWPGAKVTYVWVNGTRLEHGTQYGRTSEMRCYAHFDYPGCTGHATYCFGDENVSVLKVDNAAWHAFVGRPLPDELEAA